MSYPPPPEQPDQPGGTPPPPPPGWGQPGGYGPPPPGGYPPPPGYGGYPMPAPPTHSKAVVSLVLGILSLVMCGLFTGIPAMITGRSAKREIATSGGRLGGEGLASAGFITGLIGTILSALGILLVVAVFAVGATAGSSPDDACNGFNEDGVFVEC